MTAVICWSMKMRMVPSRAGRKAMGIVYKGFLKGDTTHPRDGRVGLNSLGTWLKKIDLNNHKTAQKRVVWTPGQTTEDLNILTILFASVLENWLIFKP